MAVSPGGATRYPRPMTSPASEENRPMPGVPAEEVNRPQQSVSASLACIKCEYDLRGVSADANCPECGTPIGHTLAKTFPLNQASPRYIARLYWGSVLVLGSWAWTVFNILVGAYWSVIGRPSEMFSLVHLHMGTIFDIVYFTGCWLLSTPQTAALDRSERGSGRRFLRFIVFICYGIALVRIAMQVPGVLEAAITSFDPAHLSAFSNAVQTAGLIAMAAIFFTYTTYLGKLASRIPDRRLVAWVGTVRWLVPLVYVVAHFVTVAPFPHGVRVAISLLFSLAGASFCVMLVNWLRADLQAFRKASRDGGA